MMFLICSRRPNLVDGERSIYRLAKGRERKTRDLDQVKCVKDEEDKVLVHEKDIKERWNV